MRYARLTKDEHRGLHADLRAGQDISTIAARFRVTSETVRYHQKGCAASEARFDDGPPEVLRLDPPRHRAIHRRLESGASIEAVMGEFDLIWSHVLYHQNQHCDFLLPTVATPGEQPPLIVQSKEVIPLTDATKIAVRARIEAGDDLHAIAEDYDYDVTYAQVRAMKAALVRRGKVSVPESPVVTPDAEQAINAAAERCKTERFKPEPESSLFEPTPETAELILSVLKDKRDALMDAYEEARTVHYRQLDALDLVIALWDEGDKS